MSAKYIFYSYSILSLLFVLFSFLFISPQFIYLRSFYTDFYAQHRAITTSVYGIFILLFFALFLFAIKMLQKKKLHHQDIKKIVILLSVIFAFAYPAMLSTDIFNYIMSAKIIMYYHQNPYLYVPAHFQGDPSLLFTNYRTVITAYGPSWTFVSLLPYILGFGDYLVTMYFMKLLSVIFFGATVWLLWKMNKNIFTVLLFALNPLVIYEILLSGHNDILMMFFALAAYYLLQKKYFLLACLMLLFSIGVKYVTVILAPVFIYCLLLEMRGKKVHWEKMYFISGILMLCMFFVSYFHKEIYPWYVIWFMVFSYLIPQRKSFLLFTTALSFGMLLTDLPFMLIGANTFTVQWSKFLLASGGTLVFFIAAVVRRRLIV